MSLDAYARQAEARRQRARQLQQTVTPGQARGMAGLARENPSLSPGALYGAGSAGMQAGTPASKALSDADNKVKSEKGNLFQRALSGGYKAIKMVGGALTPDAVGERILKPAFTNAPVKGFVRGAFMGAEALPQTIQGAFREAVSDGDFGLDDATYKAVGNFAKGFQQTDVYQADKQIRDNGGYAGLISGKTDVDYGSGYFAGGKVRSDAIQARRSAAPLIDDGKNGKAVTVGRYFANSIGLEPGSTAFSIASGLPDFAIALGADPTTYIGGVPLKSGAKAASFSGDASKAFTKLGDEGLAAKRLADRGVARPSSEDLAAEIGAVRGVRNTVNSDRVLEWLTTNKQGQQVVEALSKETDFGKLYDMTKGKFDGETILALTGREMTGDEVIGIIGKALGTEVGTANKFGIDAATKVEMGMVKPWQVGTLANAKFQQKARDVRLLGAVPDRVLRKDDLRDTLATADNFMKNFGVSSGTERSEILRDFAKADGGEGMYDAARRMMNLGSRRAQEEFGISEDLAQRMFKMFEDSNADNLKYWQEQIADGANAGWVNRAFNAGPGDKLADGTARALPHLAAEFLNRNIPLPDPRDIRAGMSKYAGLLGNKGRQTVNGKSVQIEQVGSVRKGYNDTIKMSEMAVAKITEEIFKPLVLLRPAFMLRNQIDEQFRPAAVGLNSLMRNPLQYMHWVLSDEEGLGKLLNQTTGFKSRGATTGSGETVEVFDMARREIVQAKRALTDAKKSGADQATIDAARLTLKNAKGARRSTKPFTAAVSTFERNQSGGLGNWRNRPIETASTSQRFQLDEAAWSRAMGEAVHKIHQNPIAKRIAAGEDLAKIKADWWGGNLQKFRTDLAKEGPRMSALLDEIGAANYIDDTVEYVKHFLGDSPQLRKAAALASVNGKPLTLGDELVINPAALQELDALKVLPDYMGPKSVLGDKTLTAVGQAESWPKRFVDRAFYELADRPTAYLSRSPVFRQQYYRRMENLIGFMDPRAADDLIEAARTANLRSKDIKRLEGKRRPGGTLSWDEADLVGKTDALEFTRDLFYSLHNRNQALDVARLIFPFGEAFKDSATKYAKFVKDNPVLPYRLGQAIQAGRDADLNGDGQGFFYADDVTGQEMMAIPLSDKFFGATGLEGAGQGRMPLANLNILGTSVIPGFGPVVQIAAAKMLPDEPDFNAMRKLISPYGDRDTEGGIAESFIPAWLQKVRTGLEIGSPKQDKDFATAQTDMMAYLASTGGYDIRDPASAQALMDDAKGKTRLLFVVRGIAQAILPSPPSPEFVAYDKDGVLMTQARMGQLYREIMKEQEELGTPESANRIFLETVGESGLLAIMPNTKAAPGRSPVAPKREALEFLQRNKKAAERFPTVFGLFAPAGDPDEKIDFVAYNRSLKNGDRVKVTPDEAIRMANQRVARAIYANAQDIAGKAAAEERGEVFKPTKQQRAVLKDLKAKLSEDFPGYSSSFSDDTPGLIEDLKRAAKDPGLGKTPAGQGLNIWLKAREAAEAGSQQRFGVSWTTSEKAEPIREMMRALSEQLAGDFPGFEDMYDRVLENEMARD